jgi:tetraacyldisaccharide 4'-kinase
MAVGPDRVAAGRALVEHAEVDVVVSDDGLQHYALERDVEIIVMDGERRFGNGRCLPAGPLREPRGRLSEVDFVISNGLAGRGEYSMHLEQTEARIVGDAERRRALRDFRNQPAHAVAGIGYPARFFQQLSGQGLELIEHPFPDHYVFKSADLDFADQWPVLMTEKDAVKCETFAAGRFWYVPVDARLDERFEQLLLKRLESING